MIKIHRTGLRHFNFYKKSLYICIVSVLPVNYVTVYIPIVAYTSAALMQDKLCHHAK